MARVTNDDDNPRGLPSGLVTFVFTDIEASTRLYKALGDAVHDVFDRHNELLRAAWRANRGHEIHTEGDSFFVAFDDPADAVRACIDVRRGIAAAEWPAGAAVKVRMGIHSGIAAPRHGDYMALSVHQAARIMSAAHGDQILITDTAAQRIAPIPRVTLTKLGAYRLRDFDVAPTLLRVDVDDLEVHDLPPRATPASQHNLVTPLTSFIGRSADVAAVTARLQPATAVSIVGPGGIGKTRLATEVGLDVAASWPQGVWMIELAPVEAELVVDEIAATLGVSAGAGRSRWQQVLDHVGDQTTLLILDNVEHVVATVAALVPELLRSCPNVTVLCTSREPLNSAGEVIYRLQPLDLSAEDPDPDPTARASVELFVDRARSVSPELAWSTEALAGVAEICAHLDGMPLAIEIAAAQVGVMPLASIRDGLGNHRRLLRSRDRSLPNRHRTIEGLLSWSYRLLSDPEQRLFRRLAVFGDSFAIDDAEAALAGDGLDRDDVAELTWTLVDKSLVAADFSDSATRYRLFESVQQYAMRLLIDNDDPVRIAAALGSRLLDRIAPWRVNDRRWLGDVAIELPNVRAVVDLIADAEPEMAQQLMCSVGRYHDSVQSYHAGVETLTRAAAALAHPSPSRVALLATLADLHLRMADTATAQALIDEARLLQREVGPPAWNDVAVERSDGEIATRAGDHARASAIAEEALARDLSPHGAARMWNLLGIAQFSQGRQEHGLIAFQNELDAYVDLHHAPHIGSAHGNLAEAYWRMGDHEATARHQRACLDEALALGQRVLIAFSLMMAARLAGTTQDWASAIKLHTCATRELDAVAHGLYDDDRHAAAANLDDAMRRLDPQACASAIRDGGAMTVHDAAELAVHTFDNILARVPSP